MPTTMQAIERRKKKNPADMARMDKAWNASMHMPAKYSMRAKTSFGAQIRTKMCESSDTAGPLDIGKIRYEPPHYSIRARTCKMLQLPGMTMDSVPGPGHYPIPSTSYFDHPALPMPWRTTMKGPPRFKDPKETPGPATYDTANFYAIKKNRPPRFSMRVKPKIGGNINSSFCKVTSGPLDHDVIRYKPPVYSIRARTCKMLQLPGMTMDSVPGPGHYPVPSTTSFNHPALKNPGRTKFATADRFKVVDPDDQ